jgi:hypothetical protein
MKRSNLFFAALVSLAMVSCGGHSHDESHDHDATHEQHDHDHDHDHSNAIELNNGQKWKVNEEMKPHIVNGIEMVAEYVSSKGTNYKLLAQDLQAENQNLINSCTMDGKSHDELHKWLHPHLELVDKLAKTEDATKAAELVKEIHESYHTYSQYFE